jgi:hypothetical protein
MLADYPHDFTPIIPHMSSTEIQQMRNIQTRLEIQLHTALHTAEEIYQITQYQIRALGGGNAMNSDGSSVFIEQALAEWNDAAEGAKERLNQMQGSIFGPSISLFYPDGYLNHLANDINDISSLYDIIGYLVGFPGMIPNPNYVPPPPFMDDPDWVRPNRHENPDWRDWEDDPSNLVARFVIDPSYYWNNDEAGWFNRTTNVRWDECDGSGDKTWGPLIPEMVPGSNPFSQWISCPAPNPPADGTPCSCGEATCEPNLTVPRPQVPNDGRVSAPPLIDDPDWQRPTISIPRYISNPEYNIWLNTPGNFIDIPITHPPTSDRWVVDDSYVWSSGLGEWINRNTGVPHSESSGNPNAGPLIFIPGSPGGTYTVRQPIGTDPPPRMIQDGYDEFPDWDAIPPRIPNTEYMGGGNLRPAIFSGRTLNNFERTLDLSLGAFATVNLEANAMWFQTGPNAMQGMVLQLKGMHTGILGRGKGDLTTLIDVRDPHGEPISEQLKWIDVAEGIVNAQRAQLGAVQNRLEYSRQSTDISSENISAAESRIRDTDMAKEMMRFTAAQVLQQAGISMLAQANQLPSSILQLLQ